MRDHHFPIGAGYLYWRHAGRHIHKLVISHLPCCWKMLCSNCDILSPNILMWWSRTMQKRPEKKHIHLNWHDLASHFWCKKNLRKTPTWDVTLQIIAPWCGANRPWLLGGTDPENHHQTLTPKSWCLFLREGAVLVLEWQFVCLHRHSRSRSFGVECGVTTLVELENMVDATQLMPCKAVARNWELAFGTWISKRNKGAQNQVKVL